MSEFKPNKSDLELEEPNSWDIISEGGASSTSSIENIVLDEVVPSKMNDSNQVFVEVTNDGATKEENPNEKELPKKKRKVPKTYWRKLKSKVKKKLKNISFTATILTLVGMTLLNCLFPYDDQDSLEVIKKEYFEALKGSNQQVHETLQKTTEMFNDIKNSTNTTNETANEEDVHKLEEQILNFATNNEEYKDAGASNSSDYRYDFHTITKELLKTICLHPTFQMLLCTLVQDVYLYKLIKLLERKKKKIEALQNQVKSSMKINSELKNKPVKVEIVKVLARVPTQSSNETETPRLENGKSECERRFEELENKWQYLGKNHRQKMQEIKEEFQTEIHEVKGKEKEISLRKQKIKTIREKYIQKLKADREKYLMQLKKIKEERQKVMQDICRTKNVNMENQPKDTSVGNGKATPEVELKTTLNNLKKESEDVNKIPLSLLRPIRSFEEYSKFWEKFSPPLQNNNEPLKRFSYGPNEAGSSSGFDKKNSTELKWGDSTFTPPNNLPSKRDVEAEKSFLKSLKKPEDRYGGPLKKMRLDPGPSGSLSFGTFTDIPERRNAASRRTGRRIKKPTFKSATFSSLIDKCERENSDFDVTTISKANKQDWYELFFDSDGERIKKIDEELYEDSNRKFVTSNLQLFSKQDPKKIPKKVYLFKGKL